MKKFLSLVLAAMMLLAMASVAMADDTFTITIDSTLAGHTYKAYQIFAGTADNNNGLSNYTWGDGISEAGKTHFGDAVTKGKSLTDAEAANTFAKAIVDGDYLGAEAGEAKTVPYTISGLAGGYYLIIDVAGSLTEPTTDSYSLYMMKVAGNVKVTPKVGDVSVEKKVQDVNDSKEDALDGEMKDMTGWKDTADHDIGDVIPYRLTGSLSKHFAEFETYSYKFVDEMSAGLTYVDGSVEVYIDNAGTLTKVTSGYTPTWENQILTVEFDDLKTVKNGENTIAVNKDSKVVVFYKATLNSNAVLGSQGNPNTVTLEYANNPYGEGTGTTAPDTNIVFTYKVVVNKVDGYNKPLQGATFSLHKFVDNLWVKLDLTVEGNVFSFKGLDDGIYKIVEDSAPLGYNKVEPIYFEVSATHTDATLTLDELETVTPTNETVVAEMANGDVGSFTVNLTETDATLSIDVQNLSGAQLPETGGIGTTLFYLFGGLMTAGSALVLVVRRRADADEE